MACPFDRLRAGSERSEGASLLIANPRAGRERTRRLAPLLADKLAACGLDLELRLTAGTAAGAAAEQPQPRPQPHVRRSGGELEPRWRRVWRRPRASTARLSIGADRLVVGALAHASTVLGIIPTGMANAFARELGIARAWGAACDVAAGHRRRSIDAACVQLVRGGAPPAVQLDGDAAGRTPVEPVRRLRVEMLPRALTVLASTEQANR